MTDSTTMTDFTHMCDFFNPNDEWGKKYISNRSVR